MFREIGIPGVLIDIENSTCYDLDKEREGLAGEFENQTNLRLELLEKVISHANNLSGLLQILLLSSKIGCFLS